jgi:hypothetical protein
MSQDLLTDLIRAGPNPRYTLKVLVLERFEDITTARQLMRTWADIAVALGYPRSGWKTLAMAYRRVDAGLKAGRLVKPAGGNKAVLAARPKPNPAATSSTSSVVPNAEKEKPAEFDFEAYRIDKNR